MVEDHLLGLGVGKRIALPSGAGMLFKAWGERNPGGYDVAEFCADPGYAGPRPHVHRKMEELFYGLEGEFEFLIGDEIVPLGPGSLITVSRD